MSQDGWEACDRCGDRMDARQLWHLYLTDNTHWLCSHCRDVILEWWCVDHTRAILTARRDREAGVSRHVQ